MEVLAEEEVEETLREAEDLRGVAATLIGAVAAVSAGRGMRKVRGRGREAALRLPLLLRDPSQLVVISVF